MSRRGASGVCEVALLMTGMRLNSLRASAAVVAMAIAGGACSGTADDPQAAAPDTTIRHLLAGRIDSRSAPPPPRAQPVEVACTNRDITPASGAIDIDGVAVIYTRVNRSLRITGLDPSTNAGARQAGDKDATNGPAYRPVEPRTTRPALASRRRSSFLGSSGRHRTSQPPVQQVPPVTRGGGRRAPPHGPRTADHTMKHHIAAITVIGAVGAASLVPSAFTAADDSENPASVEGAEQPSPAVDDSREDPQWFVAMAYGLHAAGRATGYTAAARAANEARKGINIWWAGSEPRGAAKASGVPTVDVIFDR